MMLVYVLKARATMVPLIMPFRDSFTFTLEGRGFPCCSSGCWRSSFHGLGLMVYNDKQPGFCNLHELQPTIPFMNNVNYLVQNNGTRAYSSSRGVSRTRKAQTLHRGDHEHIMWWFERMKECRRSSTKELIKRLVQHNLLGLDESLRNGSIKDGTLNSELLDVKRRFPREVLLCRVGEFYEAIGFDACILVDYAGLNPMSGLRNDMVPRAGCPIMNLRQTLDELTNHGFSVCIYEEIKGPNLARQRKERFVSGHAHPGSPYVYGLASGDVDVEFPDPIPVIGISRSTRGYCIVSSLETMRTYSIEDNLTEEAVVAKLRAKPFLKLFLHDSLRNDPSGLVQWREYGEGGLLWGECHGKQCEWFNQEPVLFVLAKVRELYDLDPKEEFQKVIFPCEKRPRPLYVGTATQIGILPTPWVPSLIKVIVPSDCNKLCTSYLQDLLLNPPPPFIATSIQDACRLMANVTTAIPDFTCVCASKLVKLIGEKEANYIEFVRVQNLVEDVLRMHDDPQLNPILSCLLGPTWLSTGLRMDYQTLERECRELMIILNHVLAHEGDPCQAITNFDCIPYDFFCMLELPWKGRIKRELLHDFYTHVDDAALALSNAVKEDFLPIVFRIKASDGSFDNGTKAEVCFSREHQAVWLKGRHLGRIANSSEHMSKLKSPLDAKGRKVGEDWYTTEGVEEALSNYKDAAEKASERVIELFKNLAESLRTKSNTLVSISALSIIAKALFFHVSEGRRRRWVFPRLKERDSENVATDKSELEDKRLVFEGLVPYWLDRSHEAAVPNNLELYSLNLLTGPNGGGKSSLLRSITAAAVLGTCGLMVPAESATIPSFDSIMLRMMSHDSPADGKSSFQMEMCELRTVLSEASEKSLVLVDELCRGTEIQKGSFIVASVIEHLDKVGCIGFLSTHLHGILDMNLRVKNVAFKCMGTENHNGHLLPTWKLQDGVCRESLAFETARREGILESVLERAEEFLTEWKTSQRECDKPSGLSSSNTATNNSKVDTSRKDTGLRIHDSLLDSSDIQLMCSIGNDDDVLSEDFTLCSGELKALDEDCSSSSTEILSMNGQLLDTAVMKDCNGESASYSLLSSYQQVKDGYPQTAITCLEELEPIFLNICKAKLLDMNASSYAESHGDLRCTFVRAREKPPPRTSNCSCVYVMQRPDGRFYVGQTDNLSTRINAHWSSPSLELSSFIYLQVLDEKVARELRASLVTGLPLFGFPLVNGHCENPRHLETPF